jgi:hypothetical protein
MHTAQFIFALAFGWFLADHLGHSWPWIALLTVSVSAVITFLALVVQHWSLPPAARSRRGLTVFQGQLTWLFFGTMATSLVTAVAVVLIRQRLR